MAQRRKRRTKAQIEADKAAEVAAKEAEVEEAPSAESWPETPIVDPKPMPTEPDPEDPVVAISEEVAKEELAASVELATDKPKRNASKAVVSSNEEALTLSQCPEPPCLSRARWKRGRKRGRW